MGTDWETLTISEAAAQSGLTPKAIRLYEQRGLIEPDRSQSGYRLYDDENVQLLGFIRQARAVGLTLAEIKRLLDMHRAGTQPCNVVLSLVDHRIEDLDERIATLQNLRRTLVRVQESARATAARPEEAVVCKLIERSQPESRSS